MNYDDETLMAYADGELDEVLAAEIAAAIEREPELARRVERHRALRAAGQFRAGASLASWLFGIMKNAWIDDRRARSRRGEVSLPEDSGEHPAVSPVDTNLDLWSVSEAMSKLPEDQRLAVALVLVEGMSYKEAAVVLEIPIGTLTSRLARGRSALAAALGDTP